MSDSTTASGKPVRIPGPDHPITIKPNPGRVIVSVGGMSVMSPFEAPLPKPVPSVLRGPMG